MWRQVVNHTMAGLHRAGPASPPEQVWPQRSFCERLGVVVIVLWVGELQPFGLDRTQFLCRLRSRQRGIRPCQYRGRSRLEQAIQSEAGFDLAKQTHHFGHD